MIKKNLEGKTALVTGGSRGIGAATARALAAAGADVAISYASSSEKAAAVVRELEALGVRAVAFQADQADPAQGESLIGKVVAHFGKLDILVNNAGVTAYGSVDAKNDVAALANPVGRERRRRRGSGAGRLGRDDGRRAHRQRELDGRRTHSLRGHVGLRRRQGGAGRVHEGLGARPRTEGRSP